jgi:ABC-2 type transport system permease protein
MSTLTGTAALTRFALRRDRVRIAVWIAAIVLLVLTTAASTKGLYPTQADLDRAAVASQDNPAALAFNGPAVALDTMGGQIAFQVGAVGLVVVGLMALLMVGRLTRTEEESGRLELIRSMGVGRHAPLASGLIVVSAVCIVVGVLVTASLLSQDLPVAGSVVLGASFTVLGLLFVGVAGVAAQVTENPRVASGISGAVLGVSFAVRAVGDVGDGTVSWLSPIGLVQKSRPYADDAWWPLLLALVIAAGLVAGAASLASHRDFGGGLVAPRPGPPVADESLVRPLGLALRLQRPAILWWAFALLLTGIAYGSIADSIEEFVADNEAIADVIASSGGASLTDSYLGTSLLILALVAGGAALQATLRLRGEETAGRTELQLATPTSRSAWMRDHVVVALGGSAFTVVAGGFGVGVTYGLIIGDLGQVPRLVAASLVYLPAVWTFVGVAAALFGVAPRAATAAWALLGGALVIAMFGPVLDLPDWVLDLSPFQHVPQMPAAGLSVVPVAVLLALAAATTAVGFAGFRRRDVG